MENFLFDLWLKIEPYMSYILLFVLHIVTTWFVARRKSAGDKASEVLKLEQKLEKVLIQLEEKIKKDGK